MTSFLLSALCSDTTKYYPPIKQTESLLRNSCNRQPHAKPYNRILALSTATTTPSIQPRSTSPSIDQQQSKDALGSLSCSFYWWPMCLGIILTFQKISQTMIAIVSYSGIIRFKKQDFIKGFTNNRVANLLQRAYAEMLADFQ